MDRSFGASTTSVLHTPTPAARKPLYPDLSAGPAYSTPNRPSPSSSSALTRNVRFTDAQQQQQQQQRPAFNPYGSSSAPPTRVQSYSGSHSPPSSRLPIQRSPSSSGGAIPGSVAGMSSSISAYASPVKRVAQVAMQPVKRVEELVQKEVQQIKKVKEKAVAPMGRGEAAKRLRVNAVLLVCWWLSSRTDVYKFIAGHLVQVVPSLDTPLHLLETLLAVILCWNIFDSMRCLNRFSSLGPIPIAPPSPSTSAPSSPRPSPSSPLQHSHSSPKTRPSPHSSPAPQTPTFRSSSLSSPTPPSPQTPSSLSRSASAVLRRSFAVGGGGSPSSVGGGGSPLAKSVSGEEERSSPMHAFRARHSPVASKLSVNSKDAIDRLFDA